MHRHLVSVFHIVFPCFDEHLSMISRKIEIGSREGYILEQLVPVLNVVLDLRVREIDF